MIVKTVYTFEDGRIGTKTYSDKLYKITSRLDEDGREIQEQVYYYIRKVGTQEIYDQAIDVLPFDYEEVTEEEMKELVPESED